MHSCMYAVSHSKEKIKPKDIFSASPPLPHKRIIVDPYRRVKEQPTAGLSPWLAALHLGGRDFAVFCPS